MRHITAKPSGFRLFRQPSCAKLYREAPRLRSTEAVVCEAPCPERGASSRFRPPSRGQLFLHNRYKKEGTRRASRRPRRPQERRGHKTSLSPSDTRSTEPGPIATVVGAIWRRVPGGECPRSPVLPPQARGPGAPTRVKGSLPAVGATRPGPGWALPVLFLSRLPDSSPRALPSWDSSSARSPAR